MRIKKKQIERQTSEPVFDEKPDSHFSPARLDEIFTELPRDLREWVDRQKVTGSERGLDIEIASNALRIVRVLETPRRIWRWSKLSAKYRRQEGPELTRDFSEADFDRLVDLAKRHALVTQYYMYNQHWAVPEQAGRS